MSRQLVFVGAIALALGAAACGGKSALHPPWIPSDAGPPRFDGGPGFDGGMPDAPASPLVVDCGRSMEFTTTARPVHLFASATSPDGIVRAGWSLSSSPAGSMVTNAPTDGLETDITPDLLGAYLLTFEAEDGARRVERCQVTVTAIVGPPVAICPEGELLADVGSAIRLEGDAFDDVAVIGVRWRQVSGPSMSRLTVVAGGGAIIDVVADVAGTYQFELEAVDGDGSRDTCVVSVRWLAPPVVVCPPTISGPTRQPIRLHADAMDEGRIVSSGWELVESPAASTARNTPATGPDTTITPDRQGSYVLRFTATDDDGMSSSCTTQVIGLPSPPDVMCPATIDVSPLSTATVTATAVDDGTIVAWSWRRVSRPTGSAAGDPMPASAATTMVRTDLAGEYVVEVTARDDDGMTDTCTTTVRAVATEGLRVEISWDTDGTDMDTHLLSPLATSWFNDQDCYYANCQGGPRLEWYTPGPDDNPSLDIDDTNGFGPENINIDRPHDGTYRVGVDAYRGAGRVRVNIYCGGSTTTPRASFGPVAITSATDDLWRVADVTISGSSCMIADLSIGGRPNVSGGTAGMR